MNLDNATVITVVGIVAGPLLAYLSARSVSRQSARASDIGNAIELNKSLSCRVEKLEADVNNLLAANSEHKDTLRQAFSYIERLLLHIIDKVSPPQSIPPIPDQLTEFITVKLPEEGP